MQEGIFIYTVYFITFVFSIQPAQHHATLPFHRDQYCRQNRQPQYKIPKGTLHQQHAMQQERKPLRMIFAITG